MITLFGQDEDVVSLDEQGLILYSSQSNEWYTPARYVNVARRLMGSIDVDPASCKEANQVVRASKYYDVSSNGLDKQWEGKVWLNPPYGYDGPTRQKANVSSWIEKLIEQYELGVTTEAVLLINATTEKRWFDPLWRYPICFASVRVSFWNAQGERGRPTHGNALVYFGNNEAQFVEMFNPIGPVVSRVYPSHPSLTSRSLWEETHNDDR